MTTQELEQIESPPPATNPLQMLDRMLVNGAPPETLERMMGLYERWQAAQAKREFDIAMAAAKAELPVIIKSAEVDFTSSKGRTNYKYETLSAIARAVDPVLAKYGLSYRFRPSSPPDGPISVTCILTHREGHAEETTLSAARDESGNKNSIQAVGSTVVYLQRYTLKAALGLAAAADDDARGASAESSPPISPEDAENIRDMLRAAKCPEASFLRWARAPSIAEIPAAHYDACVEAIKQYKPTKKAS